MFGSQVRFAFASQLFLPADIHSLKHFAAVDHFTTRHLLKVEQKQGVHHATRRRERPNKDNCDNSVGSWRNLTGTKGFPSKSLALFLGEL